MQFKTQYDEHERKLTNPGQRDKIIYTGKYDESGVLQIVPTGKEDLYAYIQSHRDSVDIHVLLQRYKNGDVEALSRIQGFYGDVTDMPSTYAEVLNAVIAGENAFNELPKDIRSEFGHSFAQYMASFDNPDDERWKRIRKRKEDADKEMEMSRKEELVRLKSKEAGLKDIENGGVLNEQKSE